MQCLTIIYDSLLTLSILFNFFNNWACSSTELVFKYFLLTISMGTSRLRTGPFSTVGYTTGSAVFLP